MSDDLVKRLRDWEHVWPQDLDEPEGGLYIKAADRIKELEAKLAKAVEVMREAIRLSEQPHYGDRDGALDHCFDAIDVLRTTIAELAGDNND